MRNYFLLAMLVIPCVLTAGSETLRILGTTKRIVVREPRLTVSARKGDIICLDQGESAPAGYLQRQPTRSIAHAKFSLKRVPWNFKKIRRTNVTCTLAGPFEVKKTGNFDLQFNVAPIVYN